MFALDYDDYQILKQDRSIKFIFEATANRDIELARVYDSGGFTKACDLEQGDPCIFVVYHNGDCKAVFMRDDVFRYEAPIQATDVTIKE